VRKSLSSIRNFLLNITFRYADWGHFDSCQLKESSVVMVTLVYSGRGYLIIFHCFYAFGCFRNFWKQVTWGGGLTPVPNIALPLPNMNNPAPKHDSNNSVIDSILGVTANCERNE